MARSDLSAWVLSQLSEEDGSLRKFDGKYVAIGRSQDPESLNLGEVVSSAASAADLIAQLDILGVQLHDVVVVRVILGEFV